ncbi:MAG: alkaline phosphatase family protein [Thermoplasmataceae archaeon]
MITVVVIPLGIPECNYSIDDFRDKGFHNFIKPAFGKGCIADIPGFVESRLLSTNTRRTSIEQEMGSDESEDLVLIILDGLGYDLIMNALKSQWMKHFLSVMERSSCSPITSVFPSTTSTALFTVYMDMQPCEHEVIGYTQYIRELGCVCNMLSMAPVGNQSHDLIEAGWMPSGLKGKKPFPARMIENGVKSFIHLPGNIVNSGMSRITGAGVAIDPYFSVSQMFTAIARNVLSARGKTFHMAYVPSVDTLSHKVGSKSLEVFAELETLFYNIDTFIGQLKSRNATIIISADHGHVNVGNSNLMDISRDYELYNMLRAPIVGDARAAFLRVKCNHLEEAESHLLEKYGERYVILRSTKMMKSGYFGNKAVNRDNNDRFGDLIMVPKGNNGVLDSNLTLLDRNMNLENMVGMHGGLLAEEMIVPLIISQP